MKIGINITTFNRIEFTRQCLQSLLWTKPDINIAIVDNGSTDGTREMLLDFQKKHDIIKHLVFNKDNLYIGRAMNQGWSLLAVDCDVLGNINNDFLVEPGFLENIKACLNELDLDFVVGTVQPKREGERQITPSGKGHFTKLIDAGGAVFIRTKHFLNGFHPSSKPFSKGYVGPGPQWHKKLRTNLKGVRLARPGVVVRDSEYNNPKYVKYYDKTFSTRGRPQQLDKFRALDRQGTPRGWMNWETFLQTYYPEKLN